MIVQFKEFWSVDGRAFTINPQCVESVIANKLPTKTVTITTLSGDMFIVEGKVSEITGKLF